MNMTMLLIVIVIVVPGYFMVSRLSRNLYSYSAKMDQETEESYGSDGLEERGDENETENKSAISEEESLDKNVSGIPDEAIINENKTQTFKNDSET